MTGERKGTLEVKKGFLEDMALRLKLGPEKCVRVNYMGLSELMRMRMIFVTFCLN